MLGNTLRDRTIRHNTEVRERGHSAYEVELDKKILQCRPRVEAYRNRGRPPARWGKLDADGTRGNGMREAFVQLWTV